MDTGEPADDNSGKKVKIFDAWGQLLVMVPVGIGTTLFGAILGNKQGYFSTPAFFPNSQVFMSITTLNFYVSVAGIVISWVSPDCARGFHFIAFLCALISLTMLFQALLPDGLAALPWICLALVLSILCGLAIYHWCFAP